MATRRRFRAAHIEGPASLQPASVRLTVDCQHFYERLVRNVGAFRTGASDVTVAGRRISFLRLSPFVGVATFSQANGSNSSIPSSARTPIALRAWLIIGADVRPDRSQHTKAQDPRGSSSLDVMRRAHSQAGLAAPHGAAIQTSVDISGGQTATVVKTANDMMVSVIAV